MPTMTKSGRKPKPAKSRIGPKEQAAIDARNRAKSNPQAKTEKVTPETTPAVEVAVPSSEEPEIATPQIAADAAETIDISAPAVVNGVAAVNDPVAPLVAAAKSEREAKRAERARREAERKQAVAAHKAQRAVEREQQAAAAKLAQAHKAAEKAIKDANRPAPRPQLDLGERYNQASSEVTRLRAEFLAALDEKGKLLGVERKGEGLPAARPDTPELDAKIKAARAILDSLLEEKRALRVATPELQAATEKVNRLRREREVARLEKKAAQEEAQARLGVGKAGVAAPPAVDTD